MNIEPADLAAFEKFIRDRGKRTDQGIDYVRLQIEKLNGLIGASGEQKKPRPKLKQWRDQLDQFKAVERVMALQETPAKKGRRNNG